MSCAPCAQRLEECNYYINPSGLVLHRKKPRLFPFGGVYRKGHSTAVAWTVCPRRILRNKRGVANGPTMLRIVPEGA